LPAVALGTTDPSKAPSGYALQLSLGPLDSLIASMRLARDHKYQLLLKFVQRLHLAGQHPEWAGVRVQAAKLVFGPYTPTDKQAVLEQVTIGVEKRVLSQETAITMLMEAGFPIDDAAEELKRIDNRSFKSLTYSRSSRRAGLVSTAVILPLSPSVNRAPASTFICPRESLAPEMATIGRPVVADARAESVSEPARSSKTCSTLA
ncbi:hypothetical protein ADL27_12545, partial [Streptomyces sp. NRRL F-6602]